MTEKRFNQMLDVVAERAKRLPEWKQESIRQWERQARQAEMAASKGESQATRKR